MNTLLAVTRRLGARSIILDVHRWYRYGATVCLIAVATAGTRLLMPMGQGPAPVALLFAAVVASAWVWGSGPGVFAALLAGASTEFALAGQSKPVSSIDDWIRFAVLTGVAVLISYARPAWRRQLQPSIGRDSSAPWNQVGPVSQHSPQIGAEAQAAVVLESIKGAAITMVDHAWRFTYVNEEAARLLGRPVDQLIGSTLFSAVSDAKGSEWYGRLREAMDATQPVHFEAFVGSLKTWLEFHCYPSPQGLCFNFVNINARKKQEVLLPLPVWNDDREFTKILRKIEYTLVDHSRCYMLYQFAKQACEFQGDVAEVGVYKGGTAKLLAEAFACRPDKTVHLFDTFEGMPRTDPKMDLHHAGDFTDTSLEAVQKQLRDNRNARFYKGFFPETAGPVAGNRFCLVHVDADIYQSVKDCCAFFYPRLEKAGIMIFDDYGFSSCPGARKAVDEFFADKPEFPFYLPSGQCVVAKK